MKKYALRFTAIFAAVALCLSLGTVSFADGAKMSWSYPQPGDDMTYHWEMEKNVWNSVGVGRLRVCLPKEALLILRA